MTPRRLWLAGATMLALSGAAQAALVDRGGGMIYDTELNITWLQDWNYARTSGYAASGVAPGSAFSTDTIWIDGRMGWSAANTWANNLVFGGFDDWRLPTMTDTGAAGCNFSYAGGTDCGYSVQTKRGGTVYSEMAHLYYETLGNKAFCPLGDATCAGGPQVGWGLTKTGPFNNMQANLYWSALEYAPNLSHAWGFYFDIGYQVDTAKNYPSYAVAVRPGDVASAVPEPQVLALTLLALSAALVARRKCTA